MQLETAMNWDRVRNAVSKWEGQSCHFDPLCVQTVSFQSCFSSLLGFEDHHGQLRSARRARMALQFPSIMDMVLDSTRNSSLLRIQSSGYIGSNESLWDYAESPAIPSEIFWGSSCYLILVGSFGIASNLTVLVVFLTHKKVWRRTTTLVSIHLTTVKH